MSCRIELAQRRNFKEFFDILENTIKKSKNRKLSARQFVFNAVSYTHLTLPTNSLV